MSKIAVGSSDGVLIDEHFGRSRQFLIYEVGQGEEFHLVETRKNDFEHMGNQEDRIDALVELVADAKVVLVHRIGPQAVEALQKRGIIAVTLNGAIDKALRAYSKRGKLFEYPVEEINAYGRPDPDRRASCPLRQAKELANSLVTKGF